MLAPRVVLILALLLVAAAPAQAQEDSCESDCQADSDAGCADSCASPDDGSSGNETSSDPWAGVQEFLNDVLTNPTEICRIVNIYDPTNPKPDPDGCIQGRIYRLIRP